MANNIDFLVKVVRHPGFATQVANTGFFGKHMTEILASLSSPAAVGYGEHTTFGIASYLEAQKQSVGSGLWSGGEAQGFADWRNQRPRARSLSIVTHAQAPATAVSVVVSSPESFVITAAATSQEEGGQQKVEHRCTVKTKSLLAQSGDEHASFSVWENSMEIGGRMVAGTTSIYTNKATQAKVVDVWLTGCVGEISSHYQFTIPAANFSVDGAASSNTVASSPMPGKIIQVVAKDGAQVKKGDAIAILEAMKMEHVVYAPCDG